MPSPRRPDDRVTPLRDWVLAAVPDGLWMIDDDGRTTFANPALARMLRLEPAEMAGLTVFDVLDPVGQESFRTHLEERRRSGAPDHDLTCLVHRSDGSTFWALVSHVPVVDDDGEPRGWLYRVKDHTEHRDLYDEVVRHRQALADAQAIAGVGSWERVASGPARWSPEAYRICGVTPDDFVPTTEAFVDLLHPDDHQVVREHYARMLAGSPLDVECRLRPDGRRAEAWLRLRGVAVLDAEGRVTRASGTMQDITESKNHQRGLEFLNAMARVANESGTLLEVLVAAHQYVRPFARWPAVLVAVPTSPAPGSALTYLDLDWSATPRTTGASEASAAFARELAELAVAGGTTLHRAGPHGDRLVAGPVLVGGRLACAIVSDTASQQTPAPADLAFFEQTLALLAQVAEREWAAAELAGARDGALAASRAKSEFLATMSHEIRTPLNGVIGLSELLRRTDLTSRQQRLADGVDEAGRTLLALVDDVLDLSKIEAGRLELEQVDFDPRSVVERSAALLADRARAKRLRLVVTSAPSLPRLVRGDPVRFGQVVTNLAANAVKFTAQGEVVIHVEPVGSTIRVSVRDTGVGIRPALHEGLFEAFTQADSSTTREYGGTGLGLAISKRIVTAMDGDIGVRSVEGEGSTFWFTVPLAAASTSDRAPGEAVLTDPGDGPLLHLVGDGATGRRRADPRAPSEVVAPEHGTGRGCVLVVEDNDLNQLVAEGVLRSLGFTVQLATNGAAGVAAVARDPGGHVAILMDCQMPVLDGFDATRAIRELERGRGRTPIIAMTAAVGVEERQRCLDAGMDAFLSKPVDVARMVEVLDQWAPWVELAAASGTARPVGTPPPSPAPSPALAPAAPVTARARLTELVDVDGIDLTLVARMVDRFQASALRCVADVVASVEGASPSAVEQHAHRLRGSAANLGLADVAARCATIEDQARQGLLPDEPALAQLRQLVDQGVVELGLVVEERLGDQA